MLETASTLLISLILFLLAMCVQLLLLSFPKLTSLSHCVPSNHVYLPIIHGFLLTQYTTLQQYILNLNLRYDSYLFFLLPFIHTLFLRTPIIYDYFLETRFSFPCTACNLLLLSFSSQ